MANNISPKICILITTYNGAKTIGKTIKGILKCLESKLVTVYVYDDCSCDNTIEIIRSCWTLNEKQLVIRKNVRNLGLFQNKNRGLKDLINQYDWIFLMHQDDAPNPNWIAKHLEVIEQQANENTFVIWSSYSNYNFTNEKIEDAGDTRGIIQIEEPTEINIKFYITNIYTPYCISGSVLNSRLLDKLNYFDEQYKHFGDSDFVVRGLLEGFNHIYIAFPLLERTCSSFQASSINKVSYADIKEMTTYFKKFSSYLNKNEKFVFYMFLLNTIKRRFLKFLLRLNIKDAFSIIYYGQKLTGVLLKSEFKVMFKGYANFLL